MSSPSPELWTPSCSSALCHLSTQMHTLCWLISRIWLPDHYNFFVQSLVFVFLSRHTLSWCFDCPLTVVLLWFGCFLQGRFPSCVCRASPSRLCMPGNIVLQSHTWVTRGWLWDWGSKAFFCLLSTVFSHPTIWTDHVRLITVACYSVCSFPLLFKCSFRLSICLFDVLLHLSVDSTGYRLKKNSSFFSKSFPRKILLLPLPLILRSDCCQASCLLLFFIFESLP